jgi:hypothetical protein
MSEGGVIVSDMADARLRYLRRINAEMERAGLHYGMDGLRMVTSWRPGVGAVYLRIEDREGGIVLQFEEAP